MGKASGVSSFCFDVLYFLCRRTFLSFRFRTFLSSHSKQALTPKIVTLICLVSELKVFLQEIIDKDACAFLTATMKSLFNFLCPNHHCTLSSYLVSCLNPVSFPQRCSQDTCGPLFPCSSSSFLFSPAIFFTSFHPSLACPLQFVLFNIY